MDNFKSKRLGEDIEKKIKQQLVQNAATPEEEESKDTACNDVVKEDAKKRLERGDLDYRDFMG